MARHAPRQIDWVGLSEAGRLLGVSPATVRRWSDAGRLHVFTTPGGHRRFSRRALLRLLPSDRPNRPSLGSAGLTASRITRSYRRATREAATEMPWLKALSDDQRSLLRDRGQNLAARLVAYLDAAGSEAGDGHLAVASGSAVDYGRMCAGLGLSLTQTVEGFLRFRTPFHHELAVAARRRGFDTAETTDLLEAAEQAMDRLLLATMSGHGASAGPPAPRARAAGVAS